MAAPSPSRRDSWLLYVTAYVPYAGVAALTIPTAPPGLPLWVTLGLLFAYGVLLYFAPTPRTQPVRYHAYLALQSGLVAGLMLVHPKASTAFAILFFVLCGQAVMLPKPRSGVLWIAGLTALSGLLFVRQYGLRDGLVILLPYLGGYAFFGVFGMLMTRAENARRESQTLLLELQEAHRKLQDYAAKAEELAVAEERNRMARELHDTLGHRLTVAAVQLEGAQRLIASDPERAARMVGTVREQVREGLGELRRAVAALRAPLAADLPLLQALARLAQSFEEGTGLPVHLTLPSGLPPLPEARRQALFRAAQEGLTNVQRHAHAGQAWLELRLQPGCLALLVADDGAGVPEEQGAAGFGLRGLTERAALLGGSASLEPRPGGGAQLSFVLPLEEEVHA